MPTVKTAPIPAGDPGRTNGDARQAGRRDTSETESMTLRDWISRTLTAIWACCAKNSGLGISLLVHLVILACFGTWMFRTDRESNPLDIEALFRAQPQDSLPFDQIGVEAGDFEVASPAENLMLLPGYSESGGGDPVGDSSDSLRLPGSGIGTGGGAGGGDGSGVGSDGAEPGLGAGFFGSRAAGRTFIYVVDMSGSMFGARFERAKKELLSSIAKLKPEQKFYVFFFSDQTFPLFYPKPAKGLLSATKANRDKATRWIRAREPGGLTNPNLSLKESLKMTPDVIFLLTDGEVDDPANLRELIRKNNSNTTIHTIAFENEEGAATLEAIAQENRGTFRFVR